MIEPDIQLGVPLIVDGQEVIISKDVVGNPHNRSTREGEVLTVVEAASADGRPPISIDESELHRLRNAFPGIPVYGLWQVLFANNKVPLGNEVIVYPLGPESGLCLSLNRDEDLSSPASIIKSSEFFDNFLPDVDFHLDEATRISVSLDELVLPKSPAYTRSEIFDRNRQIQHRRWIHVSFVCAGIIVLSAIFNYVMYTNHSMKMTQYQNKSVELQTLGDRLAELQSRRLLTQPNDSVSVDRLISIFTADTGAATPTASDIGMPEGVTSTFSDELHYLLTSKGYPYDLRKKFQWLSVIKTPENRQLLTFSRYAEEGVQH